MKNVKNKLLMVGLSSLTAAPLLSSCVPANVISSNTYSSNELYLPDNGDTGSAGEACTVSYIGKNCTYNGQAIIARATDCSPKAVHLKLKHFARDEIANKVLVGKLGLRYQMPAHTYAYTSCPLSDKTSDNPVWATGMWENNGINEMGVGTSATLTCATNAKVLALENESFIKEGVGEELLPTIMTAQAATAKDAMLIAAKAIDDFGAQDANIIMATDQNESWLMEIYSRHQYCAVKLPDDKVFIAGNEFILDSLDALGINASNKDQLCITSAGLFDKVKDTDFVKYTDDTKKDIYHLDLFNTYAREGTGANDGSNVFRDTCHMRTWRGYSLWDETYTGEYSSTTKYASFLIPKDSDGKVRADMSAFDIFAVYRDEFDELSDPDSPKAQQKFVDQKKNGTLRPIAVQTTRQVHIMSSDPTKPKWIAANEWYTPSSGNYTPFLQFNNAVTSFDGDYGYYPERFIMDENCSSVLFRELNKLAWYDRTNYGIPLQYFWRVFEYIYIYQMQQVTDEVSKLDSVGNAVNIINNFNKHVRDEYIKQVKQTTKDLMWHIMDQPASGDKQIFVPLIDLENYVKELGWSNYKFDGTTATFERNSLKCSYKISDGAIYAKGKLTMNDGTSVDLRDNVVNNKVYVDMKKLNSAIAYHSEIRTININDYLSQSSNKAAWIVPTVIVGAGLIGLGAYLIIKKYKTKKATNTVTVNP